MEFLEGDLSVDIVGSCICSTRMERTEREKGRNPTSYLCYQKVGSWMADIFRTTIFGNTFWS